MNVLERECGCLCACVCVCVVGMCMNVLERECGCLCACLCGCVHDTMHLFIAYSNTNQPAGCRNATLYVNMMMVIVAIIIYIVNNNIISNVKIICPLHVRLNVCVCERVYAKVCVWGCGVWCAYVCVCVRVCVCECVWCARFSHMWSNSQHARHIMRFSYNDHR